MPSLEVPLLSYKTLNIARRLAEIGSWLFFRSVTLTVGPGPDPQPGPSLIVGEGLFKTCERVFRLSTMPEIDQLEPGIFTFLWNLLTVFATTLYLYLSKTNANCTALYTPICQYLISVLFFGLPLQSTTNWVP